MFEELVKIFEGKFDLSESEINFIMDKNDPESHHGCSYPFPACAHFYLINSDHSSSQSIQQNHHF